MPDVHFQLKGVQGHLVGWSSGRYWNFKTDLTDTVFKKNVGFPRQSSG